MTTGGQRIRKEVARRRTGKIQTKSRFAKGEGSRRQIANSIVFLNPNTKSGILANIQKVPNKGWLFDFGQAKSTHKYYTYPTKEQAMNAMREFAKQQKIKFSPGKSKR